MRSWIALRIPPPRAAARRDELWKHTCFEAFVAENAGDGYRELNFAPSGEWAMYSFTGYRPGHEPRPKRAVTPEILSGAQRCGSSR